MAKSFSTNGQGPLSTLPREPQDNLIIENKTKYTSKSAKTTKNIILIQLLGNFIFVLEYLIV